MKYYKFLDSKGESCNGGKAKWHLPKKGEDGTWKPGKWMPKIKGGLKPCKRGYHFSKAAHLPAWLGSTLWEIEVAGDTSYKGNKGTASEVRLVKQIETWDAQAARLFACDCAEHVLHIFEEAYPEDKRPRAAIAVARRFAVGEATREELDAAGDAARAAAKAAWAAEDAVWAVYGTAARTAWAARVARTAWAAWAARSAAWAAAKAAWAAEDAVWAVYGTAARTAWAARVARTAWAAWAARSAAWAAEDAVWAVYGTAVVAAVGASRAAVEAAARAAAVRVACGEATKATIECRWQIKCLKKILGI